MHKSIKPDIDTLFEWSFTGKEKSLARVRIYYQSSRTVVLVSEISENYGQSVTNGVQKLVRNVVQEYSLDPQNLIWLEHYPANPHHEEEFSLVRFIYNPRTNKLLNPEWISLTRNLVECFLLGKDVDLGNHS